MKGFPNVWTDTAFMQVENLKLLKEAGVADRVMFGSDAPINKLYFADYSTAEYLEKIISETRSVDPAILLNTIY